uniref:Uncharacterized protein n=2 Tax=viral metagenome TaxID=1070528 RepID=A0A6M3LCH1_9ZZZZ
MKSICWYYKASMDNKHDQGLIIDEETGKNIAVVYDGENTEFIVNACNNYYNFMELLNVAKMMLADAHDRDECYDEITEEMFDDFKALTDAIDKCEGRGR